DLGGDKRMAERVHRQQRSHADGVAEVVAKHAAGQLRAAGGLAGDRPQLGARAQLAVHEREREPGEIRSAAERGDDHVGQILAGLLELDQRLLADDGLVHEHVVEHAAEAVLGLLVARRSLDRLGDGDAETAGAVGILGQDRPTGLRAIAGRGDDLGAPGVHHQLAIRLLLVADLDHVDLAAEAEHLTRERQRAAPLPGAGLGGDLLYALLGVVIGLGDRSVGLVRARRASALVLVVDARRGIEGALEVVGPEHRRRSPQRVGLADALGDLDVAGARDLLLDQRHREQRREGLGSDRLVGRRVERRQRSVGHVGRDVVPVGRDLGFTEGDLALFAHDACYRSNTGTRRVTRQRMTEAPIAARRWLVSPGFDPGWCVAPGLLALVVARVKGLHSESSSDESLALWIAGVLLVDVAHVWASLYRTYLDPDARRHHAQLLRAAPLLVFLIGFMVHAAAPPLFWTALAYVAVFHFIKQQEGFVALYLRAGGERARDRSLAKLAIWVSTAGP